MASVEVSPLYMSQCTFTVDADDYEAAVDQVTFTPASSTQTWQGMKAGAVFTRAAQATWTCQIEFAQDYSTAGSLANYLFANEGQQKAVTFVPDTTDTASPTIAGTIIITPGAIGGKVNAFATASVTLPMTGKPTITPAA